MSHHSYFDLCHEYVWPIFNVCSISSPSTHLCCVSCHSMTCSIFVDLKYTRLFTNLTYKILFRIRTSFPPLCKVVLLKPCTKNCTCLSFSLHAVVVICYLQMLLHALGKPRNVAQENHYLYWKKEMSDFAEPIQLWSLGNKPMRTAQVFNAIKVFVTLAKQCFEWALSVLLWIFVLLWWQCGLRHQFLDYASGRVMVILPSEAVIDACYAACRSS